jgi:hypothetical protein
LPENAAAAVAAHAAVGVDDDLAAGEAGVGERAADGRTVRSGSRIISYSSSESARGHRADHLIDQIRTDHGDSRSTPS